MLYILSLLRRHLRDAVLRPRVGLGRVPLALRALQFRARHRGDAHRLPSAADEHQPVQMSPKP